MIQSKTTIRTIKSVHELENVRDCWYSWQNHPNSDIDHFKLICRLRQAMVSPHVIVMECDGLPCFLIVARLEQTHFEPSIGYFKPIQIPAKVLTVLYQGLLGKENDEIAEVLIQHLWSLLVSGEVDAVVFHNLSEHSILLRDLLCNGPRWWCEKLPSWSTHWSMEVPKEPGSLLQKLRSKHRSWIRKKQRELESVFPCRISWQWMKTFDDIPGLCKRLEFVAARTYQRGLGAGFSDNEEFRQRLSLFASRGSLRVLILEIQAEVRAFWIGEVYRGVFHSSATGYDPNLREYEPGTLLFIRMVDELAIEGVRHIDFGLGDAFYKSRFGDKSWRETTVRIFAPNAIGLILRSSLGFFGLIDRIGRLLLNYTGGLDHLKTRWRRLIASTHPEPNRE